MPTYGYQCRKCKAEFEVMQRITEEPLKIHDDCGGELRRLMYPVGIVFKGPGFYVNDYGKKNGNSSESNKNGSGEKSKTTSETKTETKTESKTETKTEPKAETKTEATPVATDKK